MRYTLYICLLLLSFVTKAGAEERMTTGGVQYTTTSNSEVTAYLTVKAGVGDNPVCEILETVRIKGHDYKTTVVGKAYFSRNNYVQTVKLPNSVHLIKKGAFKNCTNLTRLVVPDEPCEIEAGAFEGCTAVAYINTNANNYLVKHDYVLASLPKDIPYYTTKQTVGGDDLQVVTDDIEADVDGSIPATGQRSNSTFAYIIGNEDYEEGVARVPFAAHDAEVFASYCEKTLGLPRENITLLRNATLGQMIRTIKSIKGKADAYKGKSNIIFYYAGHGIPDEATHDAYILPVDGDGKDVETSYSLGRLYKMLGEIETRDVKVFIDACFSGILAKDSRGLALEANEEKPRGNMVVMTAATGKETAYPYTEKGHGMFTYYLLNKLNLSRGRCTMGELGEYVQQKVSQKSQVVNNKNQTPTVSFSPQMEGMWQRLQFREK